MSVQRAHDDATTRTPNPAQPQAPSSDPWLNPGPCDDCEPGPESCICLIARSNDPATYNALRGMNGTTR